MIPELAKLMDMCSVFSCKLDALVREDLPSQSGIYSEVQIRRIAPFRMASYTIVSPNPENDANGYMQRWADSSGLKAAYPNANLIGWDFPFVTQEQQHRFGLHGYVAAYALPEGFETDCPGVQYSENEEADYAVITVTDPFAQSFERIPNAYKKILEYMQANNLTERHREHVISCFEYVYTDRGITYMDVHVHAEGAAKPDAFSRFN